VAVAEPALIQLGVEHGGINERFVVEETHAVRLVRDLAQDVGGTIWRDGVDLQAEHVGDVEVAAGGVVAGGFPEVETLVCGEGLGGEGDGRHDSGSWGWGPDGWRAWLATLEISYTCIIWHQNM
jgi:hypothetical protein